MSTEKTLAYVIRVTEFSESSCVVTLYTRDYGKVSALAKGARRPKGPFESAIDLLALCRIVFIHKSSEALDLLTEAKLERRFRAATRDLSRLYAGYYVAELLNELTDSDEPQPDLFHAAHVALRECDGEASPAEALIRFEMTALRILGHLPTLDICASCGKEVAKNKRTPIGLIAGGVLCPGCRSGQRQVIGVSSDAIQVMKRFSRPEQQGQSDPPEQQDVPPAVRGELRGVLNQYFANLLGRRPRMQAYLRR